MLLKLVQLIHILNEIFLSTYIFIFPEKYDLYYSIYLIIIVLHWLFLKNECIISYLEKKIIDKNYVLGSKPYFHPYNSSVPKYLIYIFELLKFINIILVLHRNIKNKFIAISMALVIGFYFFHFYVKMTKSDSSFRILIDK